MVRSYNGDKDFNHKASRLKLNVRVSVMMSKIKSKSIINEEEHRETQIILVDFCFDLFCCLKKLSTDTLDGCLERGFFWTGICSCSSLEREALALDP